MIIFVIVGWLGTILFGVGIFRGARDERAVSALFTMLWLIGAIATTNMLLS